MGMPRHKRRLIEVNFENQKLFHGQEIKYVLCFSGRLLSDESAASDASSAFGRPSAIGIQSAACFRFSLPESPTNYMRPERRGEQANKQLVFYALDPMRGGGQELARQEIALGPEIVESNWDLSSDGSRIALAMREGTPARIRILSLVGGTLQDIFVTGWSAFQSMEWAADGKGWNVALA